MDTPMLLETAAPPRSTPRRLEAEPERVRAELRRLQGGEHEYRDNDESFPRS